jgi:uncharacterized membrane protein
MRPFALASAHRYAVAVWAAMGAWAVGLFLVVRSDYLGYRLARFDLGNMVQAVWSTTEGRPLEVTDMHGEQVSRLSGHVDPILALLAPLWVVFPTPLLLAGAQIVACAAGALPVFWLARRRLESERVAMLLALGYLAYPWLAWTALDAMHSVTLAIPLLLYAIWFLDTDQLVPFGACAVLVLATGELLGLTLAGLGLWYALARGRRTAGLVIAGVGVGWTVIALFVVVPAFSGSDSVFYGFYERVGGSPAGLVETALTNPASVLGELLDRNALVYVFALGAPLAGVFLLAPGLAAAALPQLALNALADPLGPVDPRQHYLAAVVPVLFAATVFGLARLRSERRVPLAATILGISLVFTLVLGPWPGAPGAAPLWYQTGVSKAHADVLDRAISLVPDGAPVSATNKVGLRLAARRYLAPVPVLGEAEWVVLDGEDPALVDATLPVVVRDEEGLAALKRRLESSPRWAKVFDEDGVSVFRRLGA